MFCGTARGGWRIIQNSHDLGMTAAEYTCTYGKDMNRKEKKETNVQQQTADQQEVNKTSEAKAAEVGDQNSEGTITALQTSIVELEGEVERLSGELAAEKEQFIRKVAEMDNYRKRLIREKESAVQFANERLLNDIIPILDDFDRAVEAADQAQDIKSYAEGIQLIRKQLVEMLNRNWGLKRMDDIIGTEFSPHEHEAMMMEEDDKYETETVLAELQKGYYLHDRVLRTAKVKVGKPQ